MTVHLIHATANRPGAIAILHLVGESLKILRQMTGVEDWPLGKLQLCSFADIDEGLAVRLTDDVAQLMPHGGPRVVQRLTAKLVELGACIADATSFDPQRAYPEASDRFEALAMNALARAHSPLAIDLLLDQPRRWRTFAQNNRTLSQDDRDRSYRLNRLIVPPIVVVAGRPNVGKSTLSNALLGRALSIAYDLPGTTRDYTAGRIELAGLVVDWYDTPGVRETDDPIERKAIELARRLIEHADLLIAMTDPGSRWPDLPREPDLRVFNKSDLLAPSQSAQTQGQIANQTPCIDVHVSAATGDNLATLVSMIRDCLVSPVDLQHIGPWLFDARLL